MTGRAHCCVLVWHAEGQTFAEIGTAGRARGGLLTPGEDATWSLACHGTCVADQSVRLPVVAGKRAWLAVLLAGLVVWLLAAGVTAITTDPILIPTLFLIGSFLVPVTVVAFALGRLDDCRLTTNVVLTGFLAAGTIGVVVSAVTEIYLLPTGAGPLGNAAGFFGVGLIEEVSKGAVLVAVGWGVRERTVHGGWSWGPPSCRLRRLRKRGLRLLRVYPAHRRPPRAEHSADRGVASHARSVRPSDLDRAARWCTLRGRRSTKGGFRLTKRLGWTLVGVAALHGAWDASYGWAIWITQELIGSGWIADWPDGSYWELAPTQQELWVFQVMYDGALVVNAAIGLTWVVRSWRRGHGTPGRLRP